MPRYLDADALVKGIENRRLVFKDTITVAEAMRAQGNAVRQSIDEAPTADVVEVVRCRDCKYFTHDIIGGDVECICTCGVAMIDVAPDRYCSYGERREE